MNAMLRVAAIQLNAGSDKEANLTKAERFVAEAATGRAELVVLPELFDLYGDLARAAAEAEPLEGHTSKEMRHWAAEHHLWLAGSIAVRGTDNAVRNTVLLIDPAGQIQATYAKIHLFDVHLPGRVTAQESAHFAAGDQVVCHNLDWGTAGLAVCYDLRFPELFRALTDRGMELLIAPSAFTRTTGRDHWDLLVRTRAVESQSFVVAANQVGIHDPHGASFGHSMIVDPWGRILAAADGQSECVLFAELDRRLLTDIRERLPALQHRRL